MIQKLTLQDYQNLTQKNLKMSYSTCCGAHTTMPEMGICPDCLEHCDWEEEEDEELEEETIK